VRHRPGTEEEEGGFGEWGALWEGDNASRIFLFLEPGVRHEQPRSFDWRQRSQCMSLPSPNTISACHYPHQTQSVHVITLTKHNQCMSLPSPNTISRLEVTEKEAREFRQAAIKATFLSDRFDYWGESKWCWVLGLWLCWGY